MSCKWCGEPSELCLCECCNHIRNDQATQQDDVYSCWNLNYEPDEISKIDVEIEAIERAIDNSFFVKEVEALKKQLDKLNKKRKKMS